MAMEPTFFDTNILVYATLDQDVVKKRIAVSLIMEAVASDSFWEHVGDRPFGKKVWIETSGLE